MRLSSKNLCRAIGPILFAWLIYNSEPELIWSYITEINHWWMPLLALPVSWLALFLKSLRWRSILLREDPSLSIAQAFVFYAGGMFWGSVTPGKVGELAKAKYLKERGTRYTHGIASILVDRLLDVGLLFCAALGPLLILIEIPGIKGNETWIICGSVAFLALACIGIGSWSKGRSSSSRNNKTKSESHLANSIKWLLQIPRRVWLLALGFGALATFVFLFQRMILAWSLGFSGDTFFYAGAIAAAALLSALPISVQGIGTRDAALIYVLGQVEVPAEAALALSQLILLVMIVNTALSRIIFLKGNRRLQHSP